MVDMTPVERLAVELMSADHEQAVEGFEEMWGPDRSNCGGFASYSGPCGGCYECCLAMLFYGLPKWPHYLELARARVEPGHD